jgi:capsular polysaccharide biosynthesis protein
MYEKMLKTYGEIAKSRLVKKLASEKLNGSGQTDLSFGEKEVTVTPYADTQILIIQVQNTNPNTAMLKVNILAQTFVEEANRIYPSGNVQVLDAAILPDFPVSPKTRLNIAIAFLFGIMVSLGIIFLIEYTDNTLKTEDDIEKYLGLPVIGLIPKQTKAFR